MNNLSTQIATTREQSERLLSMGVKPETADMLLSEITHFPHLKEFACLLSPKIEACSPAWSLSRLISMMPKHIISNECECGLYIFFHSEGASIFYDDGYMEQLVYFSSEDIISLCVFAIDWLIKNNHFNKEYLK